MRALPITRTCSCCGETKPQQGNFTHNPKKGVYTAYCRDCGVWLTLLRQAFAGNRGTYKPKVKPVAEPDDMAMQPRQFTPYDDATLMYRAWGICGPSSHTAGTVSMSHHIFS